MRVGGVCLYFCLCFSWTSLTASAHEFSIYKKMSENNCHTRPAMRSFVAGPTVMNNGTREAFTLILLPPSESGSSSTGCALFNSQSSSLSYLKWRRPTGPAIKQCTAEQHLDGGKISNVTSRVPLFVTVRPPTDELLSGTGLALVDESYGGKVHKGRSLPATSLFDAKWF